MIQLFLGTYGDLDEVPNARLLTAACNCIREQFAADYRTGTRETRSGMMGESAGNAIAAEKTAVAEARAGSTWVAWSSVFLAFVQSVCAAFVALSGLRLLLGAAAAASAAGLLGFVDRHFHINAIRIPHGVARPGRRSL